MRSMLLRKAATVLVWARSRMRHSFQRLDRFLVRRREPEAAHLFMICSNIKLTWPGESIGIGGCVFPEYSQCDRGNPNALPALSHAGGAHILPGKRKMPMATVSSSLKTLREEAADCRACPLWKNATQTVFGEGPQRAQAMLVGEQPGDKEDLAGKPFVGPAGQMLDRALEEAGIDRKKVYVTNAVKHFKFVPRGKIRLHQKPTTPEIKACRQWYERELASIKPDLVVAMGATSAQSVFGKITPINKNRGHLIDLDDGIKALVTVHPSYLLRLPDADAKAREYERFVDDLKIAAALLRKSDAA
jgi:DNA polymerase